MYVARANGDDITQIDTGDARQFDPTWSPEGERIAYLTPGPVAPILRVVDITTGETVTVEHGLATLANLSWSPGTEQLAVEGSVTGEGFNDIFIVPLDGSGAIAVTDDEASDTGPMWVQERWIYFVSNRGGTFEAWRHDLETGDEEQITFGHEIIGGVSASWDLSLLLFQRRTGPDSSELVLYDVAAESASIVSATMAREATFARDGRFFGVVAQVDGASFDIALFDVDTLGTVGVVTADAAVEQMPEIAPVDSADIVLGFPLPGD